MSRCRNQMIAEGATIIPKSCPLCGIGNCQMNPVQAKIRGKWFAVEDELPKDPGRYVVYVEGLVLNPRIMNFDRRIGWTELETSILHPPSRYELYVTHWQYLPELPELPDETKEAKKPSINPQFANQ